MGSEIFSLKSLYLEDTVVRGARVSANNASTTRTIEVNPGDDPVVKTGETGINKEYLIKSSLIGNELNGYGTFTQNSDIVRGYTGAQNISHSDKIKLDGDQTSYTVTGINGTEIYLIEKYTKENISGPDVLSGICSIVKYMLDSVKYEKADSNITYDKNNGEWGVTGIQMSDPIVAPEDSFYFDTGITLKFQDGTSRMNPDIATVLSTRKTLVSNNTSPIPDVSLSPIPYPHSSLQVFMGLNGEELHKAVEGEEYIINYTNSPEILYPIPPYEEREVAYIKFLDSMTDEIQVDNISSSFDGNMTIDKETQEGDVTIVKPVQDILSEEGFSIKVGGIEKVMNSEFVSNNGAGMITFVEHKNREELVDTLTYPKKLIWDGISVIKGVTKEEVIDFDNLVIPGISGLKGIDHTVYFEDTDSNNLIRDIDFIIDPESGAFNLNTPTKDDETVLVSYYVEGEDIKDEKIELNTLRLNSYPLISGSLVITKKYSKLSDNGNEITLSKILVEGIDYNVSYVTGHVQIISSSEITVELTASYTPMAQINCIARSIFGSLSYKYTIVDDVLSFTQNDTGSKNLIFNVNNPVVSVPKKILFKEDRIDSNYTFSGTISAEDILQVKIKDTEQIFNLGNIKYDELNRAITIDSSINSISPLETDVVVGTYTFESDILPYAPAVLLYTTIDAGENSFLIEGYDKTDSLKAGMVLKIQNRDPESINYYLIRSVSYQNQSTLVTVYSTFPESAIDPIFSIFDDELTWGTLSEDVMVDTTIPVDSDFVVFNGGSLFLNTNLKIGGLLIVSNQEIYTITSVESENDQTTVGIYPALRSTVTSNIRFSILPIYDEGITTLPASKLILNDVDQPAFTLRYNPPEGFEGSAKILFVDNKITIKESVSGVPNPESYEFTTDNYQDIYILAKTIQATPSTFKNNVPDLEVPDYNPFTITYNNKEGYYLGDGIWSPNTLVPFEEEDYVNIPYTFTVTPELFKYSLIELFNGKNEFTVKNSNVTSLFSTGSILAFINKISGRFFFSRVISTEFISGSDTKVFLSSYATENMVAPYMYLCQTVSWIDLTSSMIGIDRGSSKITFYGTPRENIREGTILNIGQEFIYQVQSITQNSGAFDVFVNSEIDSGLTAQTYSGYVKISNVPIALSNPGPQPYIQITYSAPITHVGYASVKVDITEMFFKEVVDNFNVKETTLRFIDYESFEELKEAINNIESYVSGNKPFNMNVPNNYSGILSDNFDNYALKDTSDQYVTLPNNLYVIVAAFDIDYTLPSGGYGGTFSTKVTSDYIKIKEVLMDLSLNDYEKETTIFFNETSNLSDLILRISEIESVIPSNYPFKTTPRNIGTFGIGKWDVTHITNNYQEYISGDQTIYGTVNVNTFIPLGNLNETKLEIDTDYTIDNGVIELNTPVASLERFTLNYMGLDNLYENEGDSITCSCRFLTVLPIGYRLDVYMDYLNIDQFYIQKLTERNFSETVVVPQIEQIVEQKGSAGGRGNDSGASNNSIPNYEGGIVDINYLLQDEYIKKQLYLRFYQWYKQRLRGLSAEMQLGLGFKFAHSNAVGEAGGYYTLNDYYVENEDYTLTKDSDIDQIQNGFSKFFPVGYNGQAPKKYDRFVKEHLSFNEVYCCNILYRNDKNEIVTVGVVKSDKPYWNRTSDLVFKVWEDQYINKNLIGYYSVDVPEDDRSFSPSNYTFLRIVDSGDKIKIDRFKNYYTISEIVSPTSKSYEYMIMNKAFTDKGIKTYNIVDRTDAPFNIFMDNLPPDGYRIWIQRQEAESFPMFDDYGDLGATAYSDDIEGLIKDSRRIKKPFLAGLIKLFFPLAESTKNFSILVKKDSEASWELLGSIDLSKLTFKEERNIDDIMDALRFDFTEKFTVPVIPPVTVYDIKEDDSKGFFRYFYLSFEKVYDADVEENGYYRSVVLRAKDRNWWFKIVNGGESPIVGDYGFSEEKVYENFYDPDNIYKRLLLEKQAWQTEELILRDLYDYSDKIARAFDDGDLNRKNSKYQGYLAMPDGDTISGISDILRTRIPAYEKQLRFLIDPAGPVFRTLYPDLVHAEDSASPEIATTYNQTLYAWNLYNTFYNKMVFYNTLNENNNYVWKNDYVRWALSAERGIIPQEVAKGMYEDNSRILTVGLEELSTINISLSSQSKYTVSNALVTLSSTYSGKYIQIIFDLEDNDSGIIIPSISCVFYLYTNSNIEGVPTVVYKSIDTICSEISAYSYEGINVFTATNIYEYFENDVLQKSVLFSNQTIDSTVGIDISSTNVADHRSSDPRILFLNKKIEDRVYTHEIRELPGFEITYLGNYYLLKYGTEALSISLDYPYGKENFRYGIFKDDNGEKILSLAYEEYEETIYTSFKLYNENGGSYEYKTIHELSNEISYNYNFSSSPVWDQRSKSCDTLITTSGYVSSESNYLTPYLSTDSTYSSIDSSVNQFYYKPYVDDAGIKKMDIIFYDLIADGRLIYKSNTISDSFTFSFQKSDSSFKTLSEISQELSNFTYRGEKIMSAVSVYEAAPGSALSTTFIIADSSISPVGSDWEIIIYVDTYVEAITGSDNNSRKISDLKNTLFSFPMYTANGNPNKTAIEDIPVSGSWNTVLANEIIEVGCIDGLEWSLSFSDFDAGDYKSYMTPQEILDIIESGEALTEEQYNQIKVIEDRPSVAVLKELILSRTGADSNTTVRFNLRKYRTINELIEAIVAARFNADGEYDINGERAFFTANLIGDPNIEGNYKSNELYTIYVPVVKSFRVELDDGTIEYKTNHVVGWQLTSITLAGNVKHRVKMSEKRYSFGDSYDFTMGDPETAYIDTLYNYPQGFRRDILAFDIYSWDYNAQYVIQDNWIYFKSDSVDYSSTADLGQPDKTLGYGIPLAGSGHPSTNYRESVSDLINRINDNDIINVWFYANLKFTRDDKNDPGYFEYNYLPNYSASIPRSIPDHIMLKDDWVLRLKPGNNYRFTSSNITIDGSADTIDLTCDWESDHTYERTFFFNEVVNRTLGGLVNSISNDFPPEIFSTVIDAEILDPPNVPTAMSKDLLPSFIDKTIAIGGTNLKMYVGTYPTRTLVDVVKLSIPTPSGSNYTINNTTYSIPKTRDRITIKVDLTYHNTYTLSGYHLDYSIGVLGDFLSSIRPYSDSLFTSLFSCVALADNFRQYESSRLYSVNSSILLSGVLLKAYLIDITAFKVLNMTPEATIVVSENDITVISFKTFTSAITERTDLHAFVESVKGDYSTGFLSCDVLPLIVPSTTTGSVNMDTYNLTSSNTPAHVYFGIMGDIKFVQISDFNLHVQYNYIKERLGMPWYNLEGELDYDYYTPETYNENNPTAIDLNNFLGYLRTGRYNQIRDSLADEAIVFNKYFWLYMKFHKEFGCDQRSKTLKDAIEKGNTDMETLNQIL